MIGHIISQMKGRPLDKYLNSQREKLQNQEERGMEEQVPTVKEITLPEIELLLGATQSCSSLSQFFQRHWSTLKEPFQSDNEHVQSHIVFWEFLAHFFQKKEGEYASIVSDLVQFLFQFKGRHNWDQLKQLPALALAIGSVIDLLVFYLKDEERMEFAEWLVDVEMMKTVFRLTDGATVFISPSEAPNLFFLIRKGLMSSHFQSQTQAASILEKIFKSNEQSQNQLIFDQDPSTIELLLHVLRLNSERKEAIYFFPAVLSLLDASPSHLLRLAQLGIVPLCRQLISSGVERNVYAALKMLMILLTGCGEYESEMVDILAGARGSLWLGVCFEKRVFATAHWKTRKLFTQIIRNILFRWRVKVLTGMLRQCGISHIQLLEMISIIQEIPEEEDQLILGYLSCTKWMLSKKAEKILKFHALDMISSLVQSGVMPYIEKCYHSSRAAVSEEANEILEVMDSLQKMEVENVIWEAL